jgi:glycolate oxidase iron-sulfur subunit
MQTRISEKYRRTRIGEKADTILRSCVHCGFCTATCPTYQLLGDELDGPRGRIYLIKQMLEGNETTSRTRLHLDRCLSCDSCENTCPSGVQYGRLIDIGREIIEKESPRPLLQRVKRSLLRKIIPHHRRFSLMLNLGRLAAPLLPAKVRNKIPARQTVSVVQTHPHRRKMLLLEACGQRAATPATNNAARHVLDKLGVELVSAPGAGCCGSLSQHMAASKEARQYARNNIDAWWPLLEQDIEAIVITASGCGTMVKDYGKLLEDDGRYADKAQRVAELTMDISEVIAKEDIASLSLSPVCDSVAFHSPCTLQHSQKLGGLVEHILEETGFELTRVRDSHLCCGSAGTYSILQPKISRRLLIDKTAALQKGTPDVIATANIGCQLHLSTHAAVPVRHWIELISDSIPD